MRYAAQRAYVETPNGPQTTGQKPEREHGDVILSGDPARHSRHLKLISIGVSYGYERLKNNL